MKLLSKIKQKLYTIDTIKDYFINSQLYRKKIIERRKISGKNYHYILVGYTCRTDNDEEEEQL